MKEENPYQPIEGKVVEIIEETQNIKTFVIIPKKEISFKTGQFMELTYPGVGEAPFTPSSSPFVEDKLEFTIMKTGGVTTLLHEAKPGLAVGLRGPFGKGYPVEQFQGKEVLIVGGGVGLAPLRSLLFTLLAQAVGKTHIRMLGQVLLNFPPVPLVIPDVLTLGADGQQARERLDFGERLFQLASQVLFPVPHQRANLRQRNTYNEKGS